MSELIELKRAGNKAMAKRDYVSAELAFKKAITIAPDSPEGYVGLSTAFQRQSKHEDVLELLKQKAPSLNSEMLYRLLGESCRVLVNRGRNEFLDDALTSYERYHQRRSDPVTMYYCADLLFAKKKDYAGALLLFEKSWNLDPKSKQAFEGVLKCLKKLGREEEISEYKSQWEDLE